MKVSPQEYDQTMALREASFGNSDYTPTDSIDHFEDGTYYLARVDNRFRRYYAIKGVDGEKASDGDINPKLPSGIFETRLLALDRQFAPNTNNAIPASTTTPSTSSFANLAASKSTQLVEVRKSGKSLDDDSVMKSMLKNFHKQPLQQR